MGIAGNEYQDTRLEFKDYFGVEDTKDNVQLIKDRINEMNIAKLNDLRMKLGSVALMADGLSPVTKENDQRIEGERFLDCVKKQVNANSIIVHSIAQDIVHRIALLKKEEEKQQIAIDREKAKQWAVDGLHGLFK